jgi:WD40 repeat protein
MRHVHTLFERGLPVGELLFAPDGSALATTGGYRGYAIRLWDCASWTSKGILSGHKKPYTYFAFAASNLLLSGASDKQVKAWDCGDYRQVAAHTHHRNAITAVACNAEGTRVVSGDKCGSWFSWSIGDFPSPEVFGTFDGRVNSLAFSPGGELLAGGGGTERMESMIHIWDSESGSLIRSLEGHSDWVLWVGFSNSGTLMASGSYGEIRVWDTRSWSLLRILTRPDGERFSTIAFSFSSHDDVFISGAWSHEEFRHEVHDASGKLLGWKMTRKGLVQFWDLRSGRLNDSVEAHSTSLRCLAYNQKNGLLATGSENGVVKVWSLNPTRETRT